jgi:hypothetical protein
MNLSAGTDDLQENETEMVDPRYKERTSCQVLFDDSESGPRTKVDLREKHWRPSDLTACLSELSEQDRVAVNRVWLNHNNLPLLPPLYPLFINLRCA